MLMFCIVEGFLLVIIGVEKRFGETSLSISLKVKRVVMCLDWMFTS
jgi:phosphoribosylamine-glycine ligase